MQIIKARKDLIAGFSIYMAMDDWKSNGASEHE